MPCDCNSQLVVSEMFLKSGCVMLFIDCTDRVAMLSDIFR